MRPPAAQYRETPGFEAAIDIAETCVAHPGELCFDGGAAVECHAVAGAGDLLLCGAQCAYVLLPEALIAFFRRLHWAQHLLGIHEKARTQGLDDAGALGGVVEMMDGERRHDDVLGAAEIRRRHVGDGEAHRRLAMEALPGLIEHPLRCIDQVQLGLRKTLQDHS